MDRFARLLRGGGAAAADLALCALVGGAAAAAAWAVVTPVDPAGADVGATGAVHARPRLGAAARLNDPLGARPSLAASSLAAPSGDIILHATRSGPEGAGSAILSFAGLPQTSFHVGEMIADGVRLSQVGVDHIEIERAGIRERISFPASPLAPGFSSPPVEPPRSPQSADIAELGFRQATRAGEPHGYEYVGGDPLSLDLLGIKPGDILLAVNGRPLDPDTLAAHHATLAAGGPAQLTLERAGAVRTIQLGTSRQ